MSEELIPHDPRMELREPTAATPMAMLAMAVQNGADIEKMEKLMALAERYDANEARKAFVAAMAEFKANPPEIFKDKRVGFESKRTGASTSYSHATIGNVVEKIAEGLGRHGMSHRWELQQTGAMIRVTCILTHCRGHSESAVMEAIKDDSGQKNPIQQVASTVSYLQRYTLLAATGLATKDQVDRDGRDAAGESVERPVGTQTEPEAPDINQDVPAWQELAPEAWRDQPMPNGGTYGELADLPGGDKALFKLWATHRTSPALCAWAAGWITRTLAKLGIVWPGLPELVGMPENFEDLNPAGLWTVAVYVRRIQVDEGKVGRGHE